MYISWIPNCIANKKYTFCLINLFCIYILLFMKNIFVFLSNL